MQPSPAEIAVRLDTWQQRVRALLGLLVLVALTGAFVYAALVTADSTAKQVGAWAVAGVLLAITIAIAVGTFFALRPQWLVFSAVGFRRRVSGGREWQVAWADVAHVGVHRGYHVYDRYRRQRFGRTEVWSVWLEIVPAPDVPAERFARLAQYRGMLDAAPDAYAVWLGPVREVASRLDEGAHAYAGAAYVALNEEGDLRGRPISRGRRRGRSR